MVRRWGMITTLILTAVMTLPVMAQDKNAANPSEQPVTFYKLDLVVREMDGNKIVNARNYTINQRGDDWGRFRVGSRIPISVSSSNSTTPGSLQYIDVGLNADCHILETVEGPTLNWTIDLSSVAPETVANGQPVIRNVRSQGQTILSFNKPVILSSSDDLSSTHKFVFEVTATKIK
jgi:hypothetical protein